MGDKGGSCEVFVVAFNKVKPYIAMIALQFGYAGMYIVTMLCLKRGLSHYVLVVYRHAAATIAVAPFAYFFERKVRPKMTFSIFWKIMLLGLIEPVIDQNLYYVGMRYTSASFTSAMVNVLPAITFIMAIIFRLERVKIRKLHSQAKIVGTIVTLGGAMIMTLYKGPIIEMVWSSGHSHEGSSSGGGSGASTQHWLVGTLMLLGSCVGWSSFFILQSFTLRKYPTELSLTSLICFMGMIQGGVVALVMEHDFKNWAIGFDSRLLAPVYSGLVCSAAAYYLQGVVIKERGPVFVTAFNPLCMIITTILGSLVLAEQIHLGSIIGAIIIVIGLYSVVWGKSKDQLATSPIATTDYATKTYLPMLIAGDTKANHGVVMSEIPIKIALTQK
ncbi:hypothetical protein GIB67_003045 [Kingdonia uniflora]|uniref:WAT1-related protein n=1 Tax=Kingdonia uniflora TaxID=39325 RepID=A0A7J7LYS5_9MAGN|nr:hypothetical protein GIB67_003045 [Kingdonia uniflora]